MKMLEENMMLKTIFLNAVISNEGSSISNQKSDRNKPGSNSKLFHLCLFSSLSFLCSFCHLLMNALLNLPGGYLQESQGCALDL